MYFLNTIISKFFRLFTLVQQAETPTVDPSLAVTQTLTETTAPSATMTLTQVPTLAPTQTLTIAPVLTETPVPPTVAPTMPPVPIETVMPTPVNFLGLGDFSNTQLIIMAVVIAGVLVLAVILILVLSRILRKPQGKPKPPLQHRGPTTQPAQGGSEVITTPPVASTGSGYGLQLVLPDGKVQPIQNLPASIGRGAGNTIVISDDSVSTTHATIYYDQVLQAVCIEDQGSLNGTFVNGRPTRKNILSNEDKITLGEVSLTYQDTGFIPS